MTVGVRNDVVLRVEHLSRADELLSAVRYEEKTESLRFPDGTARCRFILGRALRRRALADLTGKRPLELVFSDASDEKPAVSGLDGVDFNLSHAGDYVVAVAARHRVGVDLELVRDVRDADGIARKYFHPDEWRAYDALTPGLRKEAFFVLWAAREAAVKCTGVGLARGMRGTRIDPAILAGNRATGVAAPETPVRVSRLEAPPGYVLMLAEADF